MYFYKQTDIKFLFHNRGRTRYIATLSLITHMCFLTDPNNILSIYYTHLLKKLYIYIYIFCEVVTKNMHNKFQIYVLPCHKQSSL